MMAHQIEVWGQDDFVMLSCTSCTWAEQFRQGTRLIELYRAGIAHRQIHPPLLDSEGYSVVDPDPAGS